MSQNVKNLITEFLEHLEIEKGSSKLTIRNYRFYLNRFLNQTKVNSPLEITLEKVRKYRLWLSRLKNPRGGNLCPATQNYHLIALRVFLKYLSKRDIKALAPEKIDLAKTGERQISFLEGNDLEKFLEAPLSIKQKEIIKLRDKAILELLFSTGLRVSELSRLKKEDVNLKKNEFSVKGKGGHWRVVFLSNQAQYRLKKYLEARKDMEACLFLRYDRASKKDLKKANPGLTPRSIQRLIKKYAKVAGLTRNITPHSLRHCLHPETRIFLPNQICSARELFKRQEISVINYDWKKFRTTHSALINKSYHKNNLLLSIWAGGYELVCSPKHRLFTIEENGIKEIKAGNLKIGQCVAGVKQINFSGCRTFGQNFWRFFGYCLGDGNANLRRRAIVICDKDKNIIDFYGQLCEKVFNKKPKIEKCKDRNSYQLILYKLKTVKFLRAIGMDKKSKDRRIHLNLFQSTAKEIRAFLAGFYDAEGNNGPNIKIFSSSKDLLKDYQMLLLRLGIDSHLYTRNRIVTLPQGKRIKNTIFILQLLYLPDQIKFKRQIPTLKKKLKTKPRYVGEKVPVESILRAIKKETKLKKIHFIQKLHDKYHISFSRYATDTYRVKPTKKTLEKIINSASEFAVEQIDDQTMILINHK